MLEVLQEMCKSATAAYIETSITAYKPLKECTEIPVLENARVKIFLQRRREIVAHPTRRKLRRDSEGS
jgi:hypothetical protein